MFEDGNHNSMFLSWWEMAKERNKELARGTKRGRGAATGGTLWGPQLQRRVLAFYVGYGHATSPWAIHFLLCVSGSPHQRDGFHRVEDILNTYIQ